MEMEQLFEEVKKLLPGNYASVIASRLCNPHISKRDVSNVFNGFTTNTDKLLPITEEAAKLAKDMKQAKNNLKSAIHA